MSNLRRLYEPIKKKLRKDLARIHAAGELAARKAMARAQVDRRRGRGR